MTRVMRLVNDGLAHTEDVGVLKIHNIKNPTPAQNDMIVEGHSWMTDMMRNWHHVFVSREASDLVKDVITSDRDAFSEHNFLDAKLPFEKCVFEFDGQGEELNCSYLYCMESFEGGTENESMRMYSIILLPGKVPMLAHAIQVQKGQTIRHRPTAFESILEDGDQRNTLMRMGFRNLADTCAMAVKLCAIMAVKDGPLEHTDKPMYSRQLARQLDRNKRPFRDPEGRVPNVVRVDLSPSGKQHLEIMQDEELGEKGGVRKRAHWVRGHLMRTATKGLVWRKAHVRGFGDAALRPHVVTIRPAPDDDPDMEMAQ